MFGLHFRQSELRAFFTRDEHTIAERVKLERLQAIAIESQWKATRLVPTPDEAFFCTMKIVSEATPPPSTAFAFQPSHFSSAHGAGKRAPERGYRWRATPEGREESATPAGIARVT